MTATENNEKALLKKISELESELKKVKKQKKYGLVWEDKPEQIVEDCKRNVPILRLKEKKKGIDPIVITDESKDDNILIEGDNYHALSVLNYTHKGKIDVVYIDPPYNTGNKDFIYNDSYIDKDDSFRHTKWLSFMEKRLLLAKNVLNSAGVIFISIDDNEQAPLKMLCDGVFGEDNFVAQFIVIRAEGGGMAKQAVIGHEYVIVYAKDIKRFSPLRKEKDVRGKIVNLNGEDYVIEEDWLRKEFGKYGTLLYSEIESIKGIEKKNEIDQGIADGKYVLLNKPQGQIVGRYKKLSDESSKFYTILKHLNKNGKDDLEDLGMREIFDYPKPKSLIKELIWGATFSKKSGTILDFFAGSGTTGQAVLELNSEDNGNRNFILCTNNENNICEEVTYQRVKKVIGGYKSKETGKTMVSSGNLRYYKTDLVDIEKLHHTPDNAKVKLTYQAGEMIGLRENTLNEVEKNDWWQIFEGHGKTSAIYFKEDKEKLQDLVELLEKKKQPVVLYVFSWGKNEYKSEYSSVNIRVEDIPEPILEVYKEINRL